MMKYPSPNLNQPEKSPDLEHEGEDQKRIVEAPIKVFHLIPVGEQAFDKKVEYKKDYGDLG